MPTQCPPTAPLSAPEPSKGLALLVHGFNVYDGGKRSVGRIAPYMEALGWETHLFYMGWMGLFQVRAQLDLHSERLRGLVLNAKARGIPIVGVGHSHGCLVLHRATTEYSAPIDRLAYINPALDADLSPGPSVTQCQVWHSPSDLPVKLAKLLRFHMWGDMGAGGYRGSDPRMVNYNCEQLPVVSSGHSTFAKQPQLAYYGPRISKELTEAT